MSEKEKKKTTVAAAKPADNSNKSKPTEKSTGKSSEKSLKQDSSRPALDKKGSKANVAEKEKSAEPKKIKSKKTLDPIEGEKKDNTAPPPPTLPQEITNILKMISDETNAVVRSYLDTLEAILKEINLEQSTKSALESSYYFNRLQDMLLRGANKAFMDIHSLTSKVLGDSLAKMKSKTKTLHSGLVKQVLSTEAIRTKQVDIEKSIIAALMQKCKEEEGKEEKTFVVITAIENDEMDSRIYKRLESRSDLQQAKLFQANSFNGSDLKQASRSVNGLIEVKIFCAPAGNQSEYNRELALSRQFKDYSRTVKINPLSEVRLKDVGKISCYTRFYFYNFD